MQEVCRASEGDVAVAHLALCWVGMFAESLPIYRLFRLIITRIFPDLHIISKNAYSGLCS